MACNSTFSGRNQIVKMIREHFLGTWRLMGMRLVIVCILFNVFISLDSAHAVDDLEKSIYFVGIASHTGGVAETPLLYSERDVRRVARVFSDLGGVDPANSVVLVDPSVQQVRKVFSVLSDGRVKKGDELIVYISSHMDPESFHLGVDKFMFSELLDSAKATGASFRIFIIDGCKSGSVTQKGLSLVGSVKAIKPVRRVAEGEVLLTSTAPDEDALESERLGGSFFTHYLVSGLMGAADIDANGKVSMEEILDFTHDNTVYATAGSPTGSQHPSFKLDLAGSGPAILTRLGGTSDSNARILVSHTSKAVAYLMNSRSGLLEAEFPLVRPGQLVVPPGEYKLRIAGPSGVFEGILNLAEAEVTDLYTVPLSRVNLLTLIRKGQGVVPMRPLLRAEFLGSLPGVQGFGLAPGFRASASIEWRSLSVFMSMSYLFSKTQNPTVEFGLHHMGLELGISHAIHLGFFALRFGIGLDGIALYEQLSAREKGVDTQGNRFSLAFGLSPLVGLDVPLGSNLLLSLSIRGKVLFSAQNIGKLVPDLGVGLGWVF